MTITAEEMQFAQKLEHIVMPYAAEKRQAAIDQKLRFVHYTSAAAALEIIRTKRMWMRNTTSMTDYREVQHGFDILNKFFMDTSNKDAFFQSVDACATGLAQEAINLFNQWWNDTMFQTYIASISEHDDTEDLHGRLSMWRAFGRSVTRVAIVFTLPLSSGAADPLNIMFSPVSYFGEARVHTEMRRVIDNIRTNQTFLQGVDKAQLRTLVFTMLVAGVVCLKHEGFHEEREWRVIYSPKRRPSSLIESSIEVISGVPQIIHKLPLDAAFSAELASLDVSALADRIIIGPSQYAWPMWEAFVSALTSAGVKDAAKRVFISGIPVRTAP